MNAIKEMPQSATTGALSNYLKGNSDDTSSRGCIKDIIQEAVRIRECLDLGVFPVLGKKPQMKAWQCGGLRKSDSIKKMFGRNVEGKLAIGVPTGYLIEGKGYLVVLDVDCRNGGEAALAKLPPLPRTVLAQTNDGFHYWFWTAKPFPSITRPDGIELKGAGCYVVVPPAPGRFWLRNPFNHEIAQAPDWLLVRPEQQALAKATAAKPVITTWHSPVTGEVGILYKPSISPLPGQRRKSLLSLAGLWNYRGWCSKEHRALLTQAGLEVGIEQSEIDRILSYVFKTIPKSKQRQAGMLNIGVVTLSSLDQKALLVALDSFRRNGFKESVADSWKDILSCRYVGERAGVDQMAACRSLRRLVGAGMLWRSPKLRRLKSGWAVQYRPTYIGVAFAEQQLGFDPKNRDKPLISIAGGISCPLSSRRTGGSSRITRQESINDTHKFR